jgi:SagB-type dehydrogenase family enzyme
MKLKLKLKTISFFILSGIISTSVMSQNIAAVKSLKDTVKIKLPNPSLKGTISVEQALAKRRSVREYKDTSLTLQDVSQILWSAYGITDTIKDKGIGLHTAPSAVAIYPLTIYLVAGKVKDMPAGIYRYNPKGQSLILIKTGDFRADLSTASRGQKMIKDAPIDIVYSADTVLMTKRFGAKNAMSYIDLDLGHSAENVYLQATALGLGTCAVGGFVAVKVSSVIKMPANEKTVYIMPVGKLKE